MEYGFRSRAGRFLQEQKKHRRWMMGFLCLAGGVTLGTLAFLKMYGQAMTHQVKVLECQYEVHEHAESCYEEDEDGRKVLVCGYADYVIHVHNDDCYDQKGTLVCPLEEHELHEHTDDCYGEEEILVCGKEETGDVEDPEESEAGEEAQAEEEQPEEAVKTETVLACGKEEHTHTDGCYPEGCSLSEHTHGDGCYSKSLACGMGEHEHDDECYDEEGLSCSKEEHVHDDGCYDSELTCSEEEHTHSDACNSNAPVCGMEEHSHSDECYEERTAGTTEVPKAEAPEITKHVHTDDCYETVEDLICGEQELHIHDDSCYDEDCFDEDGNLIEGSHVSCGLLQLEEHVHTEECFRIVELTAEEVAALNQGAVLHVHEDSCYDEDGNLICGHEMTHIHGLDCYDEDGNLICEFADAGDHEHDADCYDEDGNLTCGHESAKDHEHSADCYDEDGNLTCGYRGVKDHEHSADCYDEDGNLICGYEDAADHEHRAECYDIFGNLICGYEDAADHVHTEDCYDEDGNLICGYKLRTSYEETKVYRGGDYIVVARYNSDANLPEEAEFLAEEITPESDEEHYADREAEYKELAGDEDASMRALLKIGFYVEEDGELTEVEPESPVEIAVQFLDEDGLPEGRPVVVIHFAEGGTEKLDGSNAVDNSTTFQMESFSEIGIGFVPEEEQRELKEGVDGTMRLHLADTFEYEDDAFQITFRVEGEAILPEDTIYKPAETEDAESGDEDADAASETVSEDAEEPAESDESEDPEDAEEAGESEDADEQEAAEEDAAEDTADPEEEETGTPKLRFRVEQADKSSEEYQIFREYAEKTDGAEELYRLQVMTYSLTYGDEELDLSRCKVTAEIRPAKKLEAELNKSVEAAAAYLIDSDGEIVQNEVEVISESTPYLAGEGEEADPDAETDPENDNAEDGTAEASEEDTDSEDDAAEEAVSDEETEEDAESTGTVRSETRTLRTEVPEVPEGESIEYIDDLEAYFGDPSEYVPTELIISVSLMNDSGEPVDMGFQEYDESVSGFIMMDLSENSTFVVRASGQPNPKFTVQYYANLDVLATTGTNALTLIDTSGGKLPVNGNTTSPTGKLKYMYVDGTGKIQTVNELTEVYSSRNFEYHKAPTINYMNALVENANYELKEVWVLKSGKKADSTNKDDWDVHTYDANLHFTNREVSAESGEYILIKDNAVLRFVYDTTTKDKDFSAAFYDYDISNGWIFRTNTPTNYTDYNHKFSGDVFEGDTIRSDFLTWARGNSAWDGHIYTYTKESGINSSGNYSGSGTKLAFGNVNTGTNLGRLMWSGNDLNKYNYSGKGYQGCTFGLVTEMSGGKIQYASGVQAPKLFNEGSATGKEAYDNGQYSLKFSRVGDTYTLSAVNGTEATNLGNFSNPTNSTGTHKSIWTNNFWPMDSAPSFGTGTHDVKFGGSATFKRKTHELRFGPITQVDADYTFPESDDGKYHNSYFGMHYEVEFDLVKDYVGPLEYYFFGDDDMWVFLDGKLVCDIGGVHSSVGEYVNLWDYLHKHNAACYDENGELTCGEGITHEHSDVCYKEEKDADGNTIRTLTCRENTKKLSFFYTERGASGSTCWMQFTLPSVSSLTPETTDKDYGELKIEKTVTRVVGDKETVVDNNDEFTFSVKFTDENGNSLPDDYSYLKYDKDGNEIGHDLIIWDGGTFKLKNGEYIIVKYLPKGTKYKITETNQAITVTDNTSEDSKVKYYTDITVDNNLADDKKDLSDNKIVDGEIREGGIVELKYNNKFYLYELPETGGPGLMIVYTVAGAIIVLLGAGLVYKKKFRERRA